MSVPQWMRPVAIPSGAVTADKIAADAVDDTKINWGTGTNQVSAADVPVADTGGLTTATNVEDWLAELAASPATVLTVGSSGCQYSSLAAALTRAAALSPSSSNIIDIRLLGYVADATNHAWPDYVNLTGSGQAFTGTWTFASVAHGATIRGVNLSAATLTNMLANANVSSDKIITATRSATFYCGGAVVPAGEFVDLQFEEAAYIVGWDLLSSRGSATCALSLASGAWSAVKGGTIPATNIAASAPPTLTADWGQDETDVAMSGWTLAIASGTILRVTLASNTDATQVGFHLHVRRVV